jgi:hypothetical protein
MDGATVMDIATGNGNGRLVGQWWKAWGWHGGNAAALEQRDSDGWCKGDRRCDSNGNGWLVGNAMAMKRQRWWVLQLQQRWTAYWHRNGNGWIIGGGTVMDVAMATAMDSLLAMQWRWTGGGDGRCDSNGNEWPVSNATTMDGLLAAYGDGRLEDNVTAMQRRWSNATEMDGATVMDVAMGDGNGQLVGWWWNAWGRGSGPFVPSIFFYSGAPLFFFWGECKHQKTDRRRTNRVRFFVKMIIAPPHRRDFTIDLQQRWSINRKIGDCQCTYYLIVRALTVAVLLFFL